MLKPYVNDLIRIWSIMNKILDDGFNEFDDDDLEITII